MICVREVHKSFGRHRAVRGISFELAPGLVCGLLGPNGAGKSTTIRMLTGFLPPDRGSVIVAGNDLAHDSLAARGQIGYLPESAPLYPEMRTIDYLRFRCQLHGVRGSARRKAIARAIDRCQLAEVVTRRIGHLSKGFRQRVGLAAAIVHDPPVIILDEPTNGLDPAQVIQMRALIRELAPNRTVLISSHILAEVERTCDRVVIIARGKVRADGTPAELLAGADRRCTVEVRPGPDQGAEHLEKILRTLPGVRTVTVGPAPRASGSRDEPGWMRAELTCDKPEVGDADLSRAVGLALSRAGLVVGLLREDRPNLEAIFMQAIEHAEPEA